MRVCSLPFVHLNILCKLFRHVRPVASSIFTLHIPLLLRIIIRIQWRRFNLSHRFLFLVAIDDPEQTFDSFSGVPLFRVPKFESFSSGLRAGKASQITSRTTSSTMPARPRPPMVMPRAHSGRRPPVGWTATSARCRSTAGAWSCWPRATGAGR